jgi:hypothetical protein
MWIPNVFRHLVAVEARCNWYPPACSKSWPSGAGLRRCGLPSSLSAEPFVYQWGLGRIPPKGADVWCGDCWLGPNNGGFALVLLLCQVTTLLDANHLDLATDEFWSFLSEILADGRMAPLNL